MEIKLTAKRTIGWVIKGDVAIHTVKRAEERMIKGIKCYILIVNDNPLSLYEIIASSSNWNLEVL